MSVQNEIDRINNNIANTYATLNEAGATMPAAANSNNLSSTAASIAAVLYNKAQGLSDTQKQRARNNIGAISEVDVPKKGVDYFTPADIESIVQQVIAAMGTPVFGTVDENNNIILTGELADGTYTVKYEDADGNLVDVGTIEQGGVSYTNQLPLAIASDKTPYNGGQGWKTGYRLNSSGAETALDGMEVTGFIPAKYGDTVYLQNIGWNVNSTSVGQLGQVYIWAYDSNFNYIGYCLASGYTNMGADRYTIDASGNLKQFTVNGTFFYTIKQGNINNAAYIRLNCQDINANSIITVNEPIE